MEFIITCGTSQMGNVERLSDPQKIKNVLLDLNQAGYLKLKEEYFRKEVDPDANADFLDAAEDPAKAILRKLTEFSDNNDMTKSIGSNYILLGAELTTLNLYLAEKHQLQNRQHLFHIIRSDTYSGWFSSILLQKYIEAKGWGRTVGPYPVVNLRERPARTGIDPLLSLSRRLKEILINRKEPHPVIVMSGAFKSVIPCLTVYSIIFALPLIYQFETSEISQRLTPVQKITNAEKNNRLWADMSRLNVAENIPWFQEALDFRNSAEYLSWQE